MRFSILLFGAVCFLVLDGKGLEADTSRTELIHPLPQAPEIPEAVYRLGHQLFHDPRLSRDLTVSCATCHDLSDNGADQLRFSLGVDQQAGSIRTPTVYNAALQFVQFWDGRVRTLEEQVDGPIHHPLEMDTDWATILPRLRADTELAGLFREAYPQQGLSIETIRSALADFQRTLITQNAPFDRWLKGDENALTAEQRHGFDLFKSYGCISCHQGINAGGNMYARMGSLESYFANKGDAISQADLGRYNVTGNPDHRHVFKVPGLRTAALNRYFFHDASAEGLEEAITMMARYQLGRSMPEEDAYFIRLFIESLLGTHPLMDASQR